MMAVITKERKKSETKLSTNKDLADLSTPSSLGKYLTFGLGCGPGIY